MKGNHSGFGNSGGSGKYSGSGGNYANGKDYNQAGSSSVGEVTSIHITSNEHSKDETSQPNSVTKNYKEGELNNERYYDKDGRAYLDIDYTNHGNPKSHPEVPHEHKITFRNGKLSRESSDGRIKKWKKKN